MRGSISQSPFVSRAPYSSSWGANASDRCLPWPGYLSQKSFQCPVRPHPLWGQCSLSGRAPIKVIRIRIVALHFGVCAVTGDVPGPPSVLFCARVRVVTESAICSEPLQSPCTLYRMSVPIFRVVAVNVIHVSDLSRPSQSLTLAQTALQSLRSIADLSESHAMDLFNQCESPLDTCTVSGACVFEVVAVKVMRVSLLSRSLAHRSA